MHTPTNVHAVEGSSLVFQGHILYASCGNPLTAKVVVQSVNAYHQNQRTIEELITLVERIVEVNNRNGILSFGIIEDCENMISTYESRKGK